MGGKRRRKRNRKRGRKKRKVKSEQQILQELALVHSMAILLEEEETFISESLVNDIFSFVGQAESRCAFCKVEVHTYQELFEDFGTTKLYDENRTENCGPGIYFNKNNTDKLDLVFCPEHKRQAVWCPECNEWFSSNYPSIKHTYNYWGCECVHKKYHPIKCKFDVPLHCPNSPNCPLMKGCSHWYR